jgi:hypothetical protein
MRFSAIGGKEQNGLRGYKAGRCGVYWVSIEPERGVRFETLLRSGENASKLVILLNA